MRITYRSQHNRDYWEDRWNNVNVDKKMENTGVYPLKYAEMALSDGKGTILEAGCGAGRILRYYKDQGWEIKGIDFIASVIDKLKAEDPELDVESGDITNLRFDDGVFKYILAFGLYHNLENGLEKALGETARVLETNGKLCASFRADNIQTKLVDYLASKKLHNQRQSQVQAQFHKLNLTQSEVYNAICAAGFKVEQIIPVENMPVLYKFEFFRATRHKVFDENLGRRDGYRLSALGNFLQKTLIALFSSQFCNLFVVIARKI